MSFYKYTQDLRKHHFPLRGKLSVGKQSQSFWRSRSVLGRVYTPHCTLREGLHLRNDVNTGCL
ncbi:hypothetical protein [Calothrix sp. 336/3]|uniref:hypothetical protein n=1 Tax=Calothrix sp. 336/3 TaxID=1337936 RepID=UPI00118730F0|nr:hypothetical protein [Calothrix sp. 336/3]